MKICIIGDIHLRASRPISRLDADYLGTILGKLSQAAEIANTCDIAVLLGDIFDRPDAPHSVLIKANKAFHKFEVPLYTVIGNHDVLGYSNTTLNTTALGSLFEMSCGLNRLNIEMLTFGGEKVGLFGVHAFDKSIWSVPEYHGLKILFAHKMITNKPIPGADCYDIRDVAKQTNADIIVSGDIHYPHLETIGDKIFFNPGALSRSSIEDRDRIPQVGILDTSKAFGTINTIPLVNAPSDSVFDMKTYDYHKNAKAHREDFIESYVRNVGSVKAEAHNVKDMLMKYMEDGKTARDLQCVIRNYLDRAEADVLQDTRD